MANVGYSTLSVVPTAKGFGASLSRLIDPQMTSAGARSGSLFGKAMGIGALAVAATALAGLAAVVHTGIGETLDASAGTAQLTAGIKSTGNAANVTVDGLNALASSIQGYSGQTDDSIVKSQQLLLTFTNIQNVGADRIFDQATVATANMAAKMGGDASNAAIQLGKALNDPVLGVTSLGRAGVQFDLGQKASIKTMVAAGDTMGAQKIILKELEDQFGGAAKAAGESLPGQLNKAKRAFEDVSQSVVETFLPLVLPGLQSVAGFLTGTVVPAVQSFLKEFKNGTGPGGQFRDMLNGVGGVLHSVFDFTAAVVVPIFRTFIQIVTGAPTPLLILVSGLALLNTSMGATLVSGISKAITGVIALSASMKANWAEAGRMVTMQSAGGVSAGIMATGTAFAAGAMGSLSIALKGVLISLGPIGIAFGIAAAAMAIFSSRSESGTASTQTWTQALYDQNGALVKNAKAQAIAGIAADATLATAAKYGVSNSLMVEGLMGNATVLTSIKQKLQDVADINMKLDSRTAAQYEADAQRVAGAKAVLAVMNDTQGSLSTTAASAQRVAAALKAAGVSVAEVVVPVKGVGVAAKDMAAAFNQAADVSLSKMQGWVSETKSLLTGAKQQWQDYAKQVYAALTGRSDIGDAFTKTADQAKAVADAQKELASAQSSAGSDPSASQSQAVADAQVKLAAAQAAVKDFEANISAGINEDQLFGDMFTKASAALVAQFGATSPIWLKLREQMLTGDPTVGMGLATSLMNGFSPEMVTKLKVHDLWAGEVAKAQADLNIGQGEKMAKDSVAGLKAKVKAESVAILAVGKNIGGGVVDGFASKLGDFNTEIGKWVKEINIKWDIHSPSRVAFGVGRNIGLGKILGYKSTDAEMRDAFAPAAMGSLDSASSAERSAAVDRAVANKPNDAALLAAVESLSAEFRRQTDTQVSLKRQGAI